VEMPVTNAAKENSLHAVLLLTCRSARGTSLQILQDLNITFLAPGDPETTQIF